MCHSRSSPGWPRRSSPLGAGAFAEALELALSFDDAGVVLGPYGGDSLGGKDPRDVLRTVAILGGDSDHKPHLP